jgi:uncharacterized protein (TIGR00255 family)
MKSMTGFGYRERQDEKRRIAVTLKSYNNRFLDIVIYLPTQLAPLEQRIREFLSARILRGRVELNVRSTEVGRVSTIDIDESYVRACAEALRKLAGAAGVREKIRLSHLLRIEGILKPGQFLDMEEYWREFLPLLEAVFEDFERLRQKEGQATRGDIETLLEQIRSEIAGVEAQAPRLEEKIKHALRTRFEELLGNGVEESRVLAETAAVLSKSDIHEEIVRIRSHLASFKQILDEEGALGKKLDFLCQELNREFNTIGSKNLLAEVDSSVVVLKDSVEKIREQLRNVE